jgi:hypothetical protein
MDTSGNSIFKCGYLHCKNYEVAAVKRIVWLLWQQQPGRWLQKEGDIQVYCTVYPGKSNLSWINKRCGC